MWDRHVLPHLGRYRLKEITPEVVTNYRAELTAAGVGDASTRKGLFMLQAVMGFAVLHGAVPYNPVKAVRKPRQLSRTVRPLAPQTVEAIRRQLSLRDATLVSVLAYAGLRPGEALGLRWSSVRKRILLIEGSVSYGREKSTKTVLYARADEAKAEKTDLALQSQADGGIRTLDPRFTRAVLWPSELRRRARTSVAAAHRAGIVGDPGTCTPEPCEAEVRPREEGQCSKG